MRAISDTERREVADKLYKAANVGGTKTLKNELAKALNINLKAYTSECSHTKILRGLADLIDQPTCRNNGNRDDRYFWCSRCGYEAWTYDDSYCDPSDFSFCPDCGAEVTEDD